MFAEIMGRFSMLHQRRKVTAIEIASALITMILTAAGPSQALAHGGQIEVQAGTHGPVKLSEAQIKSVGLLTAEADFGPISTLLHTSGQLTVLPDRQADVSLRISGSVSSVAANLGDIVRAGQKLATVQARVVGNPPPIVDVTAPISGVVDGRNIIVGQNVGPDDVLFHISDLSHMCMVTRVYEEDLAKVRPGQKAYVKLLAYPGQLFEGTVSLVAPALNAETRTAEVWVLLDNPRGQLKPNLFGQADIVLSHNDAALTIPNAAILEANDEQFVFVRNGDEFDRVDVQLGAADDRYTEVLSGLVPGDAVVTVGARELYTMWLTGGKLKAEE
jgi:multidrug efflux pump subunit AcrA (membrane-fusion protein)